MIMGERVPSKKSTYLLPASTFESMLFQTSRNRWDMDVFVPWRVRVAVASKELPSLKLT